MKMETKCIGMTCNEAFFIIIFTYTFQLHRNKRLKYHRQ